MRKFVSFKHQTGIGMIDPSAVTGIDIVDDLHVRVWLRPSGVYYIDPGDGETTGDCAARLCKLFGIEVSS